MTAIRINERWNWPPKSPYPFGAVYLLEPEYAWNEVVRDVNNMAGMGFNLITLWPVANSWLAKDPAEFGFDDMVNYTSPSGDGFGFSGAMRRVYERWRAGLGHDARADSAGTGGTICAR
jgi:hypothetical protein